MSNTTKHKIEGKFSNGLISRDELPITVKAGFWRHNFETGRFRAERIAKVSRIREEAEISDLMDSTLYKTI